MQSPELHELIREHANHLDMAAPPVLYQELAGSEESAANAEDLAPANKYRALAYAMAAAVVVLILIGATGFLLTGNGSVGPVATQVPQVTVATTIPEVSEVFDLASDTVCGWFAADELDQIVAVAQERVGTAFEFNAFEGFCWDEPRDGFSARSSAGWTSSPAADGSIMIGISRPRSDAVVKFDPGALTGHELLGDSVMYQLIRYHVAYDAGLRVYLQVGGNEGKVLDFALGIGGAGGGTPMYEELGLAIANELLERMNWIEPGQGGMPDE